MTYEYECSECKMTFDVIKSVEEVNRPEVCPVCSNTLDRVFTASTIKTNDGTKFGGKK